MKKSIILSALLISTVSSVAVASEHITRQLKACHAEKDSLKRLMCYDNVVNALPAKKVITAQTVENNTQVNKEQAIQKKETIKPAITAPVVNKTQKAEHGAEAIFGNEHKPKQEVVDKVIYVIKSAKKTLRGTWKFVFENGQRWEQKDTSYAKFKVGDEVQIKRGALNAFYLKKLSSNRSIRVKRID